jgi:membrane-associated phospholipid phosphatase
MPAARGPRRPAPGDAAYSRGHERCPACRSRSRSRWPGLACLLGFVLLAADIKRRGRICQADQRVMSVMARMPRPPAVTGAARVLSALGDRGVAVAVAAAVPLLTGTGDAGQRSTHAVLRLGSGGVIRMLACRVVARPRPPDRLWLSEPHGLSFPSRHATLAVLAACAGSAGGGPAARRAAVAASVAAGLSRVYLGVHWPADVAGGWLLAAGWLGMTRPPSSCDCRLRAGTGSPRSPRRPAGPPGLAGPVIE